MIITGWACARPFLWRTYGDTTILLATDNMQVIRFNPLEPVNVGLDGTVRDLATGYIRLFGYSLHNQDAARGFVQIFFNKASNVTLGTTSPDLVIEMAASRSDRYMFDYPFESSLGMCAASTTTSSGSTGATVDTEGSFFVKFHAGT